MTRGILIAGNEAPAARALVAEASSRLETVTAALIPNRFTQNPGLEALAAPSVELLPWNPPSPISARALLIAAENRLGRLDEALLVCSPLAVRRRADELSPSELDAAVDDLVKGWFLLARELSILFRTRKNGTLALVLSEAGLGGGKDDAPDLVGAVIAASFRAFASGLLAASEKEEYRVLGFSSTEASDDAGFAAFVFKTLDEGSKRSSGKWHKYGKTGIFSLR